LTKALLVLKKKKKTGVCYVVLFVVAFLRFICMLRSEISIFSLSGGICNHINSFIYQ